MWILEFYGHFAAAFGTLCLSILAIALVTRESFDIGAQGMFLFLVISVVYAAIRSSWRRTKHETPSERAQKTWDRERILKLQEEIRELEAKRESPSERTSDHLG